MKKLLLSILGMSMIYGVNAQTTLYQNDFETTGTFIMSSTAGNLWTINPNYAGGVIFGGITIPAVPSQPAGITTPNGNYLHPLSTIAQSTGVLCSNYLLGFGSETMTAAMTSQVNTTGYTGVTLNLWRTGGSGGVRILYRVNGGAWTDSGHQLTGNPTTWQQESFTIPAGDNVNEFSIAFEFDEATAGDPAPNHYHSIDEISITGVASATTPEITASVTGGDDVFCGGDDLTVDYEVVDVTINAGNTFTLELSNASGSFATPATIGTLTGTAASGTISGTIPAGTTPGMGYRLRVNSSNDAQTGTDNGADLIVASTPPTPTITLNAGGDLESSYAGTNSWFQDGFVISGESGQTITPLANGSYTVQATNDTCVSALSDPFVYDVTSLEGFEINPFTLYPNPTSEQLSIKGNISNVISFEVIDISGKMLIQHTNSLSNIDVTGLSKGSYFLRIHTNEMIHTLKFIKE